MPAIESTFSGGAGNWTATSACAPLCTVTNTVDASSGASSPGSATVVYTTLGGLLGGLATGTSTWKSPSFTWSSATPGHATLSFARKAAVSSLLAVGGSASSRIQLDDLTTDTTTTVVTQGISAADTSFVTHEQVDRSVAAEAVALLQPARDDESLGRGAAEQHPRRLRRHQPRRLGRAGRLGGTGGTGGTGDDGRHGGHGRPAARTAAPGGARRPLRCGSSAPRVVRFQRGRSLTLRVRAARAGKAVGHLAIAVRVGNTTRRASTGRNGVATLKVSLKGAGPVRITFRAGAARATTWARAGTR